MVSTTVGVVKESEPGEDRVSLIPEQIARLRSGGLTVLVEAGAGTGAHIADADYTAAGASVVPGADVVEHADLLTRVAPLTPETAARLRDGQLVAGMLEPLSHLDVMATLAAANVTAVSLDMLPRTLSRAQT